MFGSKFMHIPDASDQVMEAFENRQINELVAYCGEVLRRGWLFGTGGAKRNAPICPDCAAADGWEYDASTGEWISPYETAGS